MKNLFFLPLILPLLFILSSCATTRRFPCGEGGDSARSNPPPYRVIKKCRQEKNTEGIFVNHGIYREYEAQTEQLVLEGQYELGKKTGRWIEYDLKGKVIRDELFESIPSQKNL